MRKPTPAQAKMGSVTTALATRVAHCKPTMVTRRNGRILERMPPYHHRLTQTFSMRRADVLLGDDLEQLGAEQSQQHHDVEEGQRGHGKNSVLESQNRRRKYPEMHLKHRHQQ